MLLHLSPGVRTKLESSRGVCGRFVVNHFWEPSDARLLVCEAKLLPDTSQPPLSSSLLVSKASSGQVRMQVHSGRGW